jgi:hypothetical protein
MGSVLFEGWPGLPQGPGRHAAGLAGMCVTWMTHMGIALARGATLEIAHLGRNGGPDGFGSRQGPGKCVT